MKSFLTPIAASILFSTSLFMAPSVYAHDFESSCDFELTQSLHVTPDHILIKKHNETLVDIYKDKTLFIKGDEIELDANKQALIHEYATSIRNAIPEVGEIAVEAIEVAFEGINAGLANFIDLDPTREKFDEIKAKVKDKYSREDGYYSFSEGSMETSIDDVELDSAIEDLVEELIPQVVGSVMANIGTAMASGETDFSHLDNLDERIDKQIEMRAEGLEKKAENFCQKIRNLDAIEDRLIASNLKFIHLDLVDLKN